MKSAVFGSTPDGRDITAFTLSNRQGMSATVMNYGATLISLCVPDRRGMFTDVVLGYDTPDAYLSDRSYFGSIVGRCANRIRNGQFVLDGIPIQVTRNIGRHHLHGGERGFNAALWVAVAEVQEGCDALKLSHVSNDGEEGYPGNLSVTVTYMLTEENGLSIDYGATTDRTTIVNLTHHSYFNLAGSVSDSILDHEMLIHADQFTEVDDELLQSGVFIAVDGTPMDFRRSRQIGSGIHLPDEQLRRAGGYDHNFVLRKQAGEYALAARVMERTSGRTMEVWTTEPGIQFYSGNFLDGSVIGKKGVLYRKHAGFCLETQHFPDAPNHPDFPSVELKPSGHFRSKSVYVFGVY